MGVKERPRKPKRPWTPRWPSFQLSRTRLMAKVALLLLAGLALTSCLEVTSSSSDEEPTPTAIPTSIVATNPTYEVQRGEVVEVMEFSAQVVPILEEELFFRRSGYVESVYVSRDQEVRKGDILAELEVTDLKNQLVQAQNELEGVELDAERRVAEAEANVHAAELRLSKARANDPTPQVTIAEINLEKARVALAWAEQEYQKALDRPWEPESTRESYANALQQAEWNYRVAEAHYQQALNARNAHVYDVQIIEQDVTLATMRLREIEAGVDVSRTLLTVRRLEAQLDDARLVAPFDGLVTAMSLIQGRMVEAYDPVIMVGDPDNLEVSADLMGSELSELAEEITVTLELPSRVGGEVGGVIRRLPYPYSGGGRTDGIEEEDKSVRITPDTDPIEIGLEMGDRVNVVVMLDYAANTLWLPPQAVRDFEGRTFVVIEQDGMQRRVDVKVGVRGTDRLEILEGVEEGQVVLAP